MKLEHTAIATAFFGILSGCSSESSESLTNNTSAPSTDSTPAPAGSGQNNGTVSSCTGFGSPHINVFVRDSLDESMLIENATVQVVSDSETMSDSDFANYIPFDDNNSDTQTGAYYASLTPGVSTFEISLEITAENYNSFVTRGIEFELDTRCMADNSVEFTAFLCPVNSNCLS